MKSYVHKTVATRLSPSSDLLLKTVLMKGAEAREAGTRWLESVDIWTLPAGSRRVFPLAYDNLRHENVEHPFMAVLKGLKRHSWCSNHLLFKAAAPVVTTLRNAGIEVMVLKGVPLAIDYYRDVALRPMGDVDLLVPFDKAAAANRLLVDIGWRAGIPLTALESQLRYDNARPFFDPSRHAIDLHWHMMPFCIGPHADDSFWEASREIEFESKKVRALHPSDQLLHTCAHGAEWGRPATVQWIADAAVILRVTADFDWDRLQKQARVRELTVCLREALRYLRDRFECPVPAEVMRSLDGTRVTEHEERRYLDVINYEPGHGSLASFGEILRRYDRISRCFGHHEGASYLDYLRARTLVEHSWEVPLAVAQWASEKVAVRVRERLQPAQPHTL